MANTEQENAEMEYIDKITEEAQRELLVEMVKKAIDLAEWCGDSAMRDALADALAAVGATRNP